MSEHGQLSSASSLTNLSSEPDYSLPRTRSASEVFEPGSIGSRRFKAKQRARDLRYSIADSRSDYYNNRRPQSISLSSQIPAHTSLRSTSSVGALGTISETDGQHVSPTNTPFSTDSIFAEPPDTPLFHYNPMLSLTELATTTSSRGSLGRHSQTSINRGSLMIGSGNHQPMNGNHSSNGYVTSPVNDTSTAAATVADAIHASEPITQQFIPLYLNPTTGQMYSHNTSDNYFRPISNNSTSMISGPPKPDKRLEEKQSSPPSSYVRFTGFLAMMFCVCGNLPVLLICSLPAFFCARKVQQMNVQDRFREANKHSEYVLCFNILGIVLHIVLILAAIIAAVVIVFAVQ